MRFFRVLMIASTVFCTFAGARAANSSCDSLGLWNKPREPFKIYGNSYYVGPKGLSSILIASDQGHILIDGALEESAPLIVANIRALGFRIEDVKLILNSHAHCDHAGGIAELQRLSGAAIKVSPLSVDVLKTGNVGINDPQRGLTAAFAPATNITAVADGETVTLGELAVTAHFTPGHTAGATSWTWRACEGKQCRQIVYADSLSAVSAPGFRFTQNTTYPNALSDFEKSIDVLSKLPCDILIATHPEFSGLWDRLARREQGDPNALIDPNLCRTYAGFARTGLEKRVAQEKAK